MKKGRARNKGVRFLICLVAVLCIASVAGVWFLCQKNIAISFQPGSYEWSNEQLNNPYCGWYHIYDYKVNDETPFDEKTVAEAVKTDNNTRLCQVKIDLGSYATGEISAEAVGQIQKILSAWSATDKQMLLGFYYSVVPEQVETVYLHIEQMSPLVNEYRDYIFTFQCFDTLGTDAMAGSQLFRGETLWELIQYQASMIDGSILLSVANMQQYEALTGFLQLPSEDMAFTETLPARLGIYSSNINRKKSQAEKQAIAQLGNFVPIGGIAGMDVGTETSIALIEEERISFLCGDDDASVTSWKNETYPGDDAFAGLTMYDYLTTHLGYRYVIANTEVSFDNWKDEKANIRLSLRNIGFANAYRLFDTSLLLKNTETDEVITIPLELDNRRWNAGQEVLLETKLDIKSYGKGTYGVYIMMLDTKSGDVIRLGNTIPLSNNGYQLGVLEIQ